MISQLLLGCPRGIVLPTSTYLPTYLIIPQESSIALIYLFSVDPSWCDGFNFKLILPDSLIHFITTINPQTNQFDDSPRLIFLPFCKISCTHYKLVGVGQDCKYSVNHLGRVASQACRVGKQPPPAWIIYQYNFRNDVVFNVSNSFNKQLIIQLWMFRFQIKTKYIIIN